jgi:thiamine biosynthesis lipoprotein
MLCCVNALLLSVLLASGGPQLVRGKRYAMGTLFEILAYDKSPEHAGRAITAALAEVERLDDVMSHFKDSSELSRVVQAARRGPVRASRDLYDVIEASLRFARVSGGAFDVTVAPLVRAWKSEDAPDEARVEELRACIGWRKLYLEPPDRVRFLSPCLDLDLGGIGKGYAVDRAAAVLRRFGVECALINAGSSTLLALAPPPGQPGWEVELPRGAGPLKLHGNSLSTSEQEAGHIIDPATGRPVAAPWAVSVLAPAATVSDALSTALLVLGPVRGRSVAQNVQGVTAFWIDRDGKVHR